MNKDDLKKQLETQAAGLALERYNIEMRLKEIDTNLDRISGAVNALGQIEDKEDESST